MILNKPTLQEKNSMTNVSYYLQTKIYTVDTLFTIVWYNNHTFSLFTFSLNECIYICHYKDAFSTKLNLLIK